MPVTQSVAISAFRVPFELELSMEGGRLSASGTTRAPYNADDYPPAVQDHLYLTTEIGVASRGGFGIEYIGGSNTMINRVELRY